MVNKHSSKNEQELSPPRTLGEYIILGLQLTDPYWRSNLENAERELAQTNQAFTDNQKDQQDLLDQFTTNDDRNADLGIQLGRAKTKRSQLLIEVSGIEDAVQTSRLYTHDVIPGVEAGIKGPLEQGDPPLPPDFRLALAKALEILLASRDESQLPIRLPRTLPPIPNPASPQEKTRKEKTGAIKVMSTSDDYTIPGESNLRTTLMGKIIKNPKNKGNFDNLLVLAGSRYQITADPNLLRENFAYVLTPNQLNNTSPLERSITSTQTPRALSLILGAGGHPTSMNELGHEAEALRHNFVTSQPFGNDLEVRYQSNAPIFPVLYERVYKEKTAAPEPPAPTKPDIDSIVTDLATWTETMQTMLGNLYTPELQRELTENYNLTVRRLSQLQKEGKLSQDLENTLKMLQACGTGKGTRVDNLTALSILVTHGTAELVNTAHNYQDPRTQPNAQRLVSTIHGASNFGEHYLPPTDQGIEDETIKIRTGHPSYSDDIPVARQLKIALKPPATLESSIGLTTTDISEPPLPSISAESPLKTKPREKTIDRWPPQPELLEIPLNPETHPAFVAHVLNKLHEKAQSLLPRTTGIVAMRKLIHDDYLSNTQITTLCQGLKSDVINSLRNFVKPDADEADIHSLNVPGYNGRKVVQLYYVYKTDRGHRNGDVITIDKTVSDLGEAYPQGKDVFLRFKGQEYQNNK